MKRIYNIAAVALVLMGLIFVGCEKEEINYKKTDTISNKSFEKNIFSELYLDTLSLKNEIFTSLGFFQNISCKNENIETMMTNYFKYRGIKDKIECDFKETEIYIKTVIKSKPEEVIDYLNKEGYLSKESAIFISNYTEEILNSKEGEQLKILQNYLTKIENEKKISLEEKNKIKFALQYSLYSSNYFDTFEVKGKCGSCMRLNKTYILVTTTLFSLGPLIGCAMLGNPVAIIGCMVGIASLSTYLEICYRCRTDCWFCIK